MKLTHCSFWFPVNILRPAHYLLLFEGLYRTNSSPSLGLFLSRNPLLCSPFYYPLFHKLFLNSCPLGFTRPVSMGMLSRSVLTGLSIGGEARFLLSRNLRQGKFPVLHSEDVY